MKNILCSISIHNWKYGKVQQENIWVTGEGHCLRRFQRRYCGRCKIADEKIISQSRITSSSDIPKLYVDPDLDPVALSASEYSNAVLDSIMDEVKAKRGHKQ